MDGDDAEAVETRVGFVGEAAADGGDAGRVDEYAAGAAGEYAVDDAAGASSWQ